jgi:hypothetical protein
VSSLALLTADVGKYIGLVGGGGAKAIFALSRLNNIADTGIGKGLIFGKLKAVCALPFLDPDENMKIRIGCASILNKISNTPVTA